MIKISIIIPAYNAEVFLGETLKSIMNQTFKNYEVIVVDDGSIDNTSKVFEQFVQQDSRFSLLQKVNGGVSSARNVGLNAAIGKYITFLDADDTYEQDYLQYLYEEISKGYDIVYCGYNYIHENGSFKNKINTTFSKKNVGEKYLKRKVIFHTSSIIIKNEYIRDNGFMFLEGISWGEDIEFFCKCLLNTKKISYVDKYLSNYRYEHSESQLSDFSPEKIDENILLFENMLKNSMININMTVDEIIRKYRIPAFIIYPLINEFNPNNDTKDIRTFVDKYSGYISNISLINGMRSIKLKIARRKLYNLIKWNFIEINILKDSIVLCQENEEVKFRV